MQHDDGVIGGRCNAAAQVDEVIDHPAPARAECRALCRGRRRLIHSAMRVSGAVDNLWDIVAADAVSGLIAVVIEVIPGGLGHFLSRAQEYRYALVQLLRLDIQNALAAVARGAAGLLDQQ